MDNIRPHEALDMKNPAKVQVRSRRPFPDKIDYYSDDIQLQYVTKNGAIRWKAYYWIYMARALAGKYVGI